jgi:hypothetical protein
LWLLVGASRRSAIGACLAASSAPLLYRGITGHGPALVNGVTERGGRIREGADAQDGSDAHAQVHAHPARAHRTGEIDPSFIITHRIGLEDAPAMYRTFRDKHDACIKVVMNPGVATPHHTSLSSRQQ